MARGGKSGELSARQIDALAEAGNIGAGNASIALSQMVGKKIGLSVPRASLLPLASVPGLAGGPEVPVAGIYMRVKGDCPGSILLLLERESAILLADMMIASSMSGVEDMAVRRSALEETSSILSGAYLNSLGELTGLLFKPSVPGFAMDMAGAILEQVLVDAAESEDHVLMVETAFEISGQLIHGHLVFFPDLGTLDAILERLGVPFE